MATTTQPATGETTKKLINYRKDAGVACDRDVRSAGQHLHLRNESPARRRDPQGAHGQRRLRHRADRLRRQVLLRRRQHQDAGQRRSNLQVLLLPARERDPAAPGAHAQAGHRRSERPLRGRRPRDRHGGRHPHCAQGCRQDWPARSEPRRVCREPAERSVCRAWWARAARSS